MFRLVISDDEGKTTTVPLVRDEVTIGRKEGNTIRLTDRNVSRRHARFQKQNSHYLLHDLGSYNGVVINGARLVDAQPVKHGDQILIGDYKLNITEEATTQVAVPPPAAGDTLDGAPTAVVAIAPQQVAPASNASPAATAPSAPAAHAPPPVPTQTQVTSTAGGEAIPDEIRQMRLVFLAPAGAPAPVSLDRLPIILGRSEAADVALPYSSISREHARLSLQGGALVIEDLGSSNGVVVNGTKGPRLVVNPGDLVTLGVVEFRVARRGDNTVVMHTPTAASAGSQSKSPAMAIAAVLGIIAVLGGGVFVFKSMGSGAHAAPPATAPELSTSATAAPASSPSVPAPAEPVQPAPVAAPAVAPVAVAPAAVVAAAPVAPAPTAPEAANPPAPTPAPAAAPAPAPAPVASAHTSESRSSHSHAEHESAAHTTTASNNAPPPEQHTASAPAPTPAPTPAPSHTQTTTASNTASTGNTSGAATASSGGGMAAARACRGDYTCVIQALPNPQTEPEVAMLAVTYRLAGNRTAAVRTMNQYLRRWPTGPRAEGFHGFLDNQ